MVWSGSESSRRRVQLPSDWRKRREFVRARAGGRCEAKVHDPRCDGVGRECDHIGDRHDHDVSNLQWLSTPCHKAKTIADKQSWKRQPEPHPGLL